MNQEDADAVSDYFTIAVNSTWKLAPWCDVLFAGDAKWWDCYGAEVSIPAKRASNSKNAWKRHGAKPVKKSKVGAKGHNSGLMAIEWAIQRGFRDIYLLGFDCSVKNGIHHHGPHTKSPNPNAGKCALWQHQFQRINEHYPDANVVNCSRYTELKAFPRQTLETVLESLAKP